jgi:hypothetical protein
MLLVDSCILRFQRTAPGQRAAVGVPEGLPTGWPLHGDLPALAGTLSLVWRFWRRSLARGTNLWRPLHRPADTTEAGPANQPAPLLPVPRERSQLPRRRAPDAVEDSRKNPLQPVQPTRNTGTPCERPFLTRIAISGFLLSRDRTRRHNREIVSGAPRNRSPKATSKTPSAPAEVTRVSVHAAAQRPTRTPPGTPLSSFRPAPGLDPCSRSFRPRSCLDHPRER